MCLVSTVFNTCNCFVFILEVQEHNERLKCLSVVIDLLPKHNKVILDRLMYHLARVAHQVSF